MKELTIEEKARAYDGLIERLKDLKFAYRFSPLSDTIKDTFPELKESEDCKIRKAVIAAVETLSDSPLKVKMLAWLEKQGKLMKALQISNARIGKLIEKNYYLKEQIEKQGEQKPTDRVEPKFHVGDWVVFKNKHESIYQVEKIKEGYYILRHTYGGTFRVCVLHDEDLRLWTIQDAKDGDVLTLISGQSIFLFDGYNKEYCHYSKLTNTFSPNFNYIGFIQHQFVPATKEQRDLLFQKMQEAGYEWDANKKELKNY